MAGRKPHYNNGIRFSDLPGKGITQLSDDLWIETCDGYHRLIGNLNNALAKKISDNVQVNEYNKEFKIRQPNIYTTSMEVLLAQYHDLTIKLFFDLAELIAPHDRVFANLFMLNAKGKKEFGYDACLLALFYEHGAKIAVQLNSGTTAPIDIPGIGPEKVARRMRKLLEHAGLIVPRLEQYLKENASPQICDEGSLHASIFDKPYHKGAGRPPKPYELLEIMAVSASAILFRRKLELRAQHSVGKYITRKITGETTKSEAPALVRHVMRDLGMSQACVERALSKDNKLKKIKNLQWGNSREPLYRLITTVKIYKNTRLIKVKGNFSEKRERAYREAAANSGMVNMLEVVRSLQNCANTICL